MNNKKNLIRLIKILLAVYLGIGLILAFNSALVLDLSLNATIIVVIFVICTLGYGVFIKNRKYITTAVGVTIAYISVSRCV